MAITAVCREYNPVTGNLIGIVSGFDFGNINIGVYGSVRVFDIYVPGVSNISNVALSITSSPKVTVNDAPIDINPDWSAGNGNFGIETSDSFIPKNTLTSFFAGVSSPVIVGSRGGNVSRFIYLNVKMAISAAAAGTAVYRVTYDYS